mgnify:CR=1 FL=1
MPSALARLACLGFLLGCGGAGGAGSYPFRAIFEWHRSYYRLYTKHFSQDYWPLFNLFYSLIMFGKLIFAEGKFLLRR